MNKNGYVIPDKVKCIPEIINDAEYKTAYMGKWHLGNEQFAQHGFQEWVSIEEYSNYYPKKKRKYSDYWHYLKSLGYTPHPIKNTYSRDFAASLPLEHTKPKFLERHAIDFLKRHKDDPFILSVNFLEPHMPFFGPLNDLHDPAEVDLPPNFNDPLEDNEPVAYRYSVNLFKNEGGFGFPLNTEKQWRRLIANYWGLVSQVDKSVGGILDALEELGLDENTIVVYTSDHGEMMGAHRLVSKDVMYEESVKVPWIIRAPMRGRKQQIISTPVSHIDLIPTLLDLMNVATDSQLPGQSLVPLLDGKDVAQDHVFIQWNPFQRPYNEYDPELAKPDSPFSLHQIYFRAVVSPDGWKLNLSDFDKNQLFNLIEDPYETSNLYYTGLHQDVIFRLTTEIKNWQKKIGDKAIVN